MTTASANFGNATGPAKMGLMSTRKEAIEWITPYLREDHSIDVEVVTAAIDALPMEKRKAYWPTLRKFFSKEIHILERGTQKLRQEREIMLAVASDLEGLKDWFEGGLVQQKPSGSAIHHLLQDLAEGNTACTMARVDVAEYSEPLAEATSFLVEHDWAKAFEGATDFSDGDFRLPFDVCVYEFKISGRQVVALMTTVDDHILMQIMIRCPDRWLIDRGIARHDNGQWTAYHAGADKTLLDPLVRFVGAQARAISIALDAQVAETEVVRAPHSLTKSREKAGKVPPKPYHIVSLARRARAAALPSDGRAVGTKKRLHFRRGHWRHFENHKTWVRWCLVGDPELGFVDKEYRL